MDDNCELIDALEKALDFIDGMVLGAKVLRGERGTISHLPRNPEIEALHEILERHRRA